MNKIGFVNNFFYSMGMAIENEYKDKIEFEKNTEKQTKVNLVFLTKNDECKKDLDYFFSDFLMKDNAAGLNLLILEFIKNKEFNNFKEFFEKSCLLNEFEYSSNIETQKKKVKI